MDINNAYQLVSEKLVIWVKEFIKLLPNFALAALVLTLGVFFSRILKRIVFKLIKRVSHNETINNLAASFTYVLAIGITIFVVLSILNLDKAVTSLLAGAGIVGLALAFAFQDIAANFVAGIIMSFRKPLRVGDLVYTNEYSGKVHTVNLRDTVITTFQGEQVYIPNKEILQNPIKNYTVSGRRRLDLVVGVSYGDDLEKVKRIAIEAASKISVRSEEDDVTLFYSEFAESSINFTIRIWMKTPDDFLTCRSEAIMLIKKAFDENDILIPFPIRTLDFGIKGGKTLSEMQLSGIHHENGR